MLVPIKYDGARLGKFLNVETPNFFVPYLDIDHEIYLVSYDYFIKNREILEKTEKKFLVDYGSMYTFKGKIDSFGILPDYSVGLNVPRKLAELSVKKTIDFAEKYKNYGAVVHGSRYVDLREACAKAFSNRPIVVVGNGYKLSKNPRLMVEIVTRIRENISPNTALYYPFAPPWYFPVLALSGVDVFDINYYILQASKGRIVVDIGAINLKDLDEVPCSCRICSKRNIDDYSFNDILKHSYFHALTVVKNIRESIKKGKFFEYMEAYSSFNEGAMTALRILYLEKFDFIDKRSPIYY